MAGHSQRWRERQSHFVVPASRFNPERFEAVEMPAVGDYRDFVTTHHYSQSLSSSIRVGVGLLAKPRFGKAELVGVATYSHVTQNAAANCWMGMQPKDIVELSRLVLLDSTRCGLSVGFNAESWFTAAAERLLLRACPEVKGVLTYADPHPRHNLYTGSCITPGHVGTIYQSRNYWHVGVGKPRWRWFTRDGRTLSDRSISKIRNAETGREYAERQLVDAGARPRYREESPRDWLRSVLIDGPIFRRRRHPGMLVYAGAIGASKRATERGFRDKLPYPKLDTVFPGSL